jgi:hypothetical protein
MPIPSTQSGYVKLCFGGPVALRPNHPSLNWSDCFCEHDIWDRQEACPVCHCSLCGELLPGNGFEEVVMLERGAGADGEIAILHGECFARIELPPI